MNEINPFHLDLNGFMYQDAQEAIDGGHVYGDEVTPLRVEKVVVVREGTEAGKPTVDFVMTDGNGKKYFFMVTGALLKSIPC